MKISVFTGNSAGRLWTIFSSLRERGGGTVFANYSAVLNVTEKDEIAYLRRLMGLTELLDEVEAAVTLVHPENSAMYLHSLPMLRNAVVVARNDNPFDGYKEHYLRPEYIVPLMYCSELLATISEENAVEQSELDSILNDISTLYSAINQSTKIKRELRLLLLELLESLRRAIHEYRIKGIGPIRKAFAAAVGETVMHEEDFKAENSNPEVSQFGSLLTKIDSILSVALKAKELLGPLVHHFPLLLAAAKTVSGG